MARSFSSGDRYQRPREKGWILSEQCQIAKRKRYRGRAKEQTSDSGQPQSAGLPSECYLLELGNLISECGRFLEFEVFGVLEHLLLHISDLAAEGRRGEVTDLG